MSQAIRIAVAAEIRRVQTELAKLTRMLATLGESTDSTAAPAKASPGRGRGRRQSSAAATDPKAVLALIKAAGKINAVSLGHQLRKQGLAKIPTAQLIEAGVKVSGTKGGTTYTYAG